MRGGTALVPARPQPMVAGGRVLGEDGRGRAVTGPRFPLKVITVTEMLSSPIPELTGFTCSSRIFLNFNSYNNQETGKILKTRKPQKKSSPQAGDSLLSLPNIGPTTAAKLEKIGITSKKQFLRRDPYKVFNELRKKADPTLCRCALAGIVGAKMGVRWHTVTKGSTEEYEKKHPRHVWGKC